jgi:hypothetical protein
MNSKPANQREYDKAVAVVKGRVARWPSAYASGQVVVEYKRAMAALGRPAYTPMSPPAKTGALARWFAEKWTDIRTGKPCGAVSRRGYYPTCRPAVRVTAATPVTIGELSRAQKARMIVEKQKAGPDTVRYADTRAVRLKKTH